jgi:hypothetical protein
MPTLLIDHEVTDLRTWLNAFNRSNDARAGTGVRSHRVSHPTSLAGHVRHLDAVDVVASTLQWSRPAGNASIGNLGHTAAGQSRLARGAAARVAVSMLVAGAGCSSSGHSADGGSSPGCIAAPARAVAKLKASLEPGATVTGLVGYRAHVDFAGSVDFLVARVTAPIHGLKPAASTVAWVWDGNSLSNFRDTGEIATPRLANFSVAGGGTDEAKTAADACLAKTLAQPQTFTVPTFTASNRLRISGALNGTVTGFFNCILTQADGQFQLGSSHLAVSISNVIAVSVINPPGGAKLWVFQNLPTGDGIPGVSVEPAGVRLHTSVAPLQGGKPLVFDGDLPCR